MKLSQELQREKLIEPAEQHKGRLFCESFKHLSASPRDLWLLFGGKGLVICALETALIGLPIYLSEVHGESDRMIGMYIAFRGVVIFFNTLFLSGFADKYGIRRAVILPNVIGFVGFSILALCPNLVVQMCAIPLFLSSSIAITLPGCKLAVKKYTKPEARSLGFSALFFLFYFGALVAALSFDIALGVGGTDYTTFHNLFLVSLGLHCVGSIFGFFVRNIEWNESGVTEWEPTLEVSLCQHMAESLKTKKFWKLASLAFIMIISNAVYMQTNVALPLFMYREFEGEPRYGLIAAFQQMLTLVASPALTFLVYYFSIYSLLILGSLLCAISPLAFLLGANHYAAALSVVGLSLGQSIHGPRLIEYIAKVAPPGKESSFLGITALPIGAAVALSGVMGGLMLESFCPEDGERRCWLMWVGFSCIGLLVPLVLICFKSCLDISADNDTTPNSGPRSRRLSEAKSIEIVRKLSF